MLYVAFTRARDLLIASGSMNMRPKGESKASHHLIRLARLLGVQMPVTGTIDMPATLTDSATGEGAAVRVQVLSAEQVMAEPAEVLESSRQEECLIPPTAGDRISESSAGVEPPREVSYSSLHRFERCPRQFLLHDILRIRHVEVLEEGAVDPSLFGSAMHAVLQLVSPEGLPPDEQRITAIGRQFELDSSQLQRLRTKHRAVRDVGDRGVCRGAPTRRERDALCVATRIGCLHSLGQHRPVRTQ